MINRKGDRLRTWALGAAATGLLWHSVPIFGIADSPSLWNKKKPAAKQTAVDTASPPRLLPESSNPDAVQQVSDTLVAAGDKSEVQRQLELLYQQDGREMPDMNFNLQTAPTAPGTTAPAQLPASTAPANAGRAGAPASRQARPAQGYTQYQPRPQSSSYPTVQPSAQPNQLGGTTTGGHQPAAKAQNPISKFFKKISGESAPLPTQAPVPPDYNGQPAPVPYAQNPASYAPQNAAPYVQNAAPYMQNAVPTNAQYAPANAQYSAPYQQNSAPTYRPSATVMTTPQATTRVPDSRPAQQQRPITQSQAAKSPRTVPNQVPAVARSAPTNNLPALQTTTNLTLPPLSPTPLPIQSALPPKVLVQTPSAPAQIAVAKSSTNVETTKAPAAESGGDFPNPFPEGAEPEVDRKLVSSAGRPTASPQKSADRIANKPKAIVSPKSETPIDEQPGETPSAARVEAAVLEPQDSANEGEPNRLATTEPIDDPFAVDGKDFDESMKIGAKAAQSDPTAPTLEPPAPLDSSSLSVAKSAMEPKELSSGDGDARDFVPPVVAKDTQAEKMQKVRERFGMKGLKGFCPVSLRDDRELIDAKPEHHFTHRGQKFHFASASARDKFQANPLRYKPAAFGADVVALSKDNEVVEGTLDFAAWYKGRLYLFGSQATYDLFVQDPVQYATLDGIE